MTFYRCLLIIFIAGCAGATAHSPKTSPNGPVVDRHEDPIVTDGDKYKMILENDRVRVLRYEDQPGDKTHQHYHRPFVLYALSAFRRRLIFPDGTTKERDFLPGEVIWMPAQIHTGENIGHTATKVIIVEIKEKGSP